MHSRKQVLSTYLHVLLLFHSQRYAIPFHNDNDRHSYPKESSDYDHDIKHYPDSGLISIVSSRRGRSPINPVIIKSLKVE